MFKKISLAILIICLGLGIWQYKLVVYLFNQAKGQLQIVLKAQPVEQYLNDPEYPDSLKYKIELIQEIRRFAFDSLGLDENENYTTMYDQGGVPLMFVVTACEPCQLKAVEWKFPIVGSMGYKGFFDKQRAEALKDQLANEGYDANVRIAGGWSTLGWLKDPILSEMLNKEEGDLAELIIHELTHGTIFIKDSLSFNENLASFIGTKGAVMFLKNKYGSDSHFLNKYNEAEQNHLLYVKYVVRQTQKLDSLYKKWEEEAFEMTEREGAKRAFIEDFIDGIADIPDLTYADRYKKSLTKRAINNTYFMSYLRYRGYGEILEQELQTNYRDDLKLMIQSYRKEFPSL